MRARMHFNINCQCYRQGKCLHHAAPPGWFSRPECLLLGTNPDPRIVTACALQAPYEKPTGRHGVPLAGGTVCGLHVHQNLRVVLAKVNLAKGNRFGQGCVR